MIVYGKAGAPVAVAAALAEVGAWIAEALAPAPAIARHGAWVSALVAAGGLAQGLADAGAEAGEAAALALAEALAAVMGRSWESGLARLPAETPAPVAAALSALERLAPALPATVTIRRTEGFAHYAVYPEGFWQAAARIEAPVPTRVLGIRSIGATLAACAAAALGAPPPVTVRPEGHPFARVVVPGAAAAAALREGADAVWAVVDEGPGLSGSSFGAAAEALGRAGVPPGRIVLVPSHAGEPGTMAGEAQRRLWSRTRRAVATGEALWGPDAGPGRRLADWVGDLTGPLRAPPEDVAGGAWRRHRYADTAEWPAADRQNERRKYLLEGAEARVLLRFTGLGSFGRAKFARARALAAAGFGLAPLAWRHGFLAEVWRGDLQPLDGAALDRPALLRRTAAYLAFRARAFPAAPHDGAAPDALLAMARANAAEALGDAAAEGIARWAGRMPALAGAAHPVAVDGRLAPHEWLRDDAGCLVKTDALDHCCGHELVGCQDIAWDVAGAAVEYGLSPEETEALRDAVARGAGRPCDPDLLAFFGVAYPAFRIGALTMALGRETGAEADRLGTALSVATAALRRALG